MAYTPIVGTLGYVVSPDRTRTLLLHRNSSPDDVHLGKYNGLGGKLRPDEDVESGMRREIREEAGVEVVDLVLRGTINWTGFGPGAESWLGFVFRIDSIRGTPLTRGPEGDLAWHPIDRLDDLPMWDGDRRFLPMVFDRDPQPFHGAMVYENDRMVSWSCRRHGRRI